MTRYTLYIGSKNFSSWSPEQVVTGLNQFALRFSRGDPAGAARRSMR